MTAATRHLPKPASPLESASPARPRSRDRPTPQSGIRLEERDVRLLLDLFLWQAMLRGQVQALHFGSVGRANARLRQLFDWQFVARAHLPLGPFGTGTDAASGCQALSTLGKAGVPLVAERLGWDAAAVRERQRRGTPTHLLHTLECVSFRLLLEAACRERDDIALVRLLPELLARRSFDVREGGDKWRAQVFKPDLVAVLDGGTGPVGVAAEIDRGHTSQAEFSHKLRVHAAAMQGGTASLFAHWNGCAPGGTFIVTTTPVRRDHLRALAAREGRTACRFTTFADLHGTGMWGPVWYAPDAPAPALFPGAAAR